MTAWQAIGLVGNAFFFSRFFVQWWLSEKAGRPVAPPIFWWLSLGGTLLLGAYSFQKGEPVLLFSFVVNTAIYVRNLMLIGSRGTRWRLGPGAAALAGAAVAVGLLSTGAFEPRHGVTAHPIWLAIGIAGTTLWSVRFIVQWWASERAGESRFPIAFWWISLAGNVLLLAYTLHVGDLVLILGYVPGPLVQVRNLMLGRAFTPARARADGERTPDRAR